MDISSMLEVEVKELKEGESKENMTPMDKISSMTIPSYSDISPDEQQFFQLMFDGDIASIRFRKLHCTACDAHIGSAPSQATNMFEHPILKTLLCAHCREFYGDGTFEQGDDETDMFCRWCANGGNLYCCSYCSNTFCYKCIKRNFDSCIRKKIEADEKWKCFVCDPTDLYPLRSMCRAIIQHVQTVSRILQNSKHLSQKEIEDKMNLDESLCCPRKRKRKRKRTGSNSEEEDELYLPTEAYVSAVPIKKRRTRRSQNNLHINGSVEDEGEESNNDDTKTSLDIMDENSSPIIHCEQTMIELENEIVSPDGSIIKSEPPNFKTVRPTLVPAKKIVSINPIPTAHLLKKSPIPLVLPARKLKVNNALVENTPLRLQPRPRPPPPMVSIPTQHSLQKRPRVLLPKPRPVQNTSSGTSGNSSTNTGGTSGDSNTNDNSNINSAKSPSVVINLDSDDEDLVVVDMLKNKSKNTDAQKNDEIHTPIITSAIRTLVPNKRKEDIDVKQFLHEKEIENVLNSLKKKLKDVVESVNSEKSSGNVMDKVRLVHTLIRRSMSRLAAINDTIIKNFTKWEKSKSRIIEKRYEPRKCTKVEQEKITLEMICSNESDTDGEEMDVGKEVQHDYVIHASKFEQECTDLLSNFVFFRKRYHEDRGVGDSRISPKDKGVQVDDVQYRDYEKCIGYSLLSKAEYDPKTNDEIFKPVMVQDEHFGKYQEQYINYLQYIEDNGITTDENKGLPDPNETPLKDLIEANSPFISEMLENIGTPPILTNGSCSLSSSRKGDLGPNDVRSKSANVERSSSKAVDKLVEMVTKLSNDIGKDEDTTQEQNQKADKEQDNFIVDNDETVIAVQALIEEDGAINCAKGSTTEECTAKSDDECTVIE